MVEKLENQELDGPLEQTEQSAGFSETSEDHDLPQEGEAEEASSRDTIIADTMVEKLENQESDSPLEQTEQIARSPETSEDHNFSSSSMVQGQEEVAMHPVLAQEVSRTKELQVISEEETISEEPWKVEGENKSSLPQADEAEKISTREITIAHTMAETLEDQKELDRPLAAMEQLAEPTASGDHDASSPLRALNSDQEEEVDMHPALEKEDSRTHDVHAKYEEEPAQEEPQELEEEHETHLLQADEKYVSSRDAIIEDAMVERLQFQNEFHSPTQMDLVADSTETSGGHDVSSSWMIQTPTQGEVSMHPVVVQEDSRTIDVQTEYEEEIIIKEDRGEVEEHRSLSLQTVQKHQQTEQIAGCTETSAAYDMSSSSMMQKPKQEEEVSMHSAVVQEDSGATSLQAKYEEAPIAHEPYKVEDEHKILLLQADESEEVSIKDTTLADTMVETPVAQKELGNPLWQINQNVGGTEEALDITSSLMIQSPEHQEEVTIHSVLIQEDSREYEEETIVEEPQEVEHENRSLLLQKDEPEQASIRNATLSDAMVKELEIQEEWGNPLVQTEQDAGIMKQQSKVEEVHDSKAETACLDEMVITDYFTCRGSRMDHPDIKEEVMASLVKDGEIDEASEEEKTIGGTSEESLDFQEELNISVVEEGVVEEPDRSYPAVSLVETVDVQGQKEHVNRITTKDLYLGSTMEELQERESPSSGKQCVHQEEEDVIEDIALEDALVKPQNIEENFDDPEVENSEPRDKFIIEDSDLAVRVAEREEVAMLVSASLIQREETEVTRDRPLCSAMEETPVVPVNSPEDACTDNLFEQLVLQGTTILELKREVSSKEITIAALKEEIASKEVTIEALKEKVDSDEATRDVNGMISGHALNIEEMIKKVATQEKTIIALEEKIGCKESTEALEEKLADQQTIIVALREKVNNQATIIEALKEKSAGQESTIEALIRELTSCKASEEQARKNSEVLEHQFSDLKGKQQSMAVKLRDVSLQYYKELKVKEVILAASKRHEANIMKLQGQLDVAMDERRALEATCEDLDRNLIEANDMCATLENKLGKMDLKLKNTDMLLSQALSGKSELQQKLKATEDLVATGMVGGTTREVDFKLEELGRLATASDEKVRAQLIIAKLKVVSLQQKNDDLERQLTQSEKKSSDKILEMEELNEKIAELTSKIQSIEEERELSKSQFVILENEKKSIETSLSISIKHNVELEEEVKCLVDKLKEQEGSTSMKQEMEELVMISESKRMEAENRVNELELQLETMRGQVKELVEALEVECAEYMNAQEELNKYHDTEKKLSVELKSFHERSAFLEQDLQAKLEKETELERLIEEKENEFECIWKELEESKVRENELLESLKSVEAQSEISQRKIQEELALVAERDSQIEEMKKKLEIVEKEAYERVASIKAELEISSAIQAKLEDTINEFKTKALDMESKVEKTLEEEAEVAKINSELKHEIELNHVKVHELEQKLTSVIAEKEAVEDTLIKIKEDNSKGLELLAKMQLQVQEFEVKMEEARVKFQASESQVQVLNAKLVETLTVLSQKSSDLEELQKKVTDLENNEEEVAEAAAKVALLTMDLEESANAKALLEQQLSELGIKVQELERKAEDSLQQFEMIKEAKAKLEKELDTQKNKFEDLQKLLSSIKGEYGTELVERIALYEVDSHLKDLETKLQDAMEDIEKGESAAKKLKEKLELALQDIAQKNCEAKELRAKLFSTEEQVEFHQRKEEEAVVVVASVKAELMASTIRRTSLEKIISELRNKIQATESKLEDLVTEKEAMDEANLKVRSELEMQQAKVDELQLALASLSAEREKFDATRSRFHVSTESSAREAHLSLQEAEDELQLRASRAEEERNQETQKFKALIAELKEQLEEYKVENSLASQLDSSLLEDEVTSALMAKISELEEELRNVEECYTHEEEEAPSKSESACQQDEKAGLLGQPAPQMTLAGQEVKTMDKDNKETVNDKSNMLAPVATVQLKRKGGYRSLDKKAFVFIFGAIVTAVLSMIGAIIYDQYYR